MRWCTLQFDKDGFEDNDDKAAYRFLIEANVVWIPKSVIKNVDEDSREVTVKEWWAKEEELI